MGCALADSAASDHNAVDDMSLANASTAMQNSRVTDDADVFTQKRRADGDNESRASNMLTAAHDASASAMSKSTDLADDGNRQFDADLILGASDVTDDVAVGGLRRSDRVAVALTPSCDAENHVTLVPATEDHVAGASLIEDTMTGTSLASSVPAVPSSAVGRVALGSGASRGDHEAGHDIGSSDDDDGDVDEEIDESLEFESDDDSDADEPFTFSNISARRDATHVSLPVILYVCVCMYVCLEDGLW